MALSDVFMGVPQSKLAGVTILLTIAIIAIFILAGKEKITFGQKIATVLLLVILALPTILLTLFQLNCVVTGTGKGGRYPWCGWYAWLVAALIVLYCVMLVVVSLTSFASSQSILADVSPAVSADAMAREFFANMEAAEGEPEEEEKLEKMELINMAMPKPAAKKEEEKEKKETFVSAPETPAAGMPSLASLPAMAAAALKEKKPTVEGFSSKDKEYAAF